MLACDNVYMSYDDSFYEQVKFLMALTECTKDKAKRAIKKYDNLVDAAFYITFFYDSV